MAESLARACVIKLGGIEDANKLAADLLHLNELYQKLWLSKNYEYSVLAYVSLTKKLAADITQTDICRHC